MPKSDRCKRLLAGAFLLFLGLGSESAWAVPANYQRGRPVNNTYRKNPQFQRRFSYIPQTNVLPGTAHKVKRKCIPHGLARCMRPPEDIRFTNRYVKERERMSPVNPLLRARGY